MRIKSFFEDYLGSLNIIKKRKEKLAKGKEKPLEMPVINRVANELHPGKLTLEVIDIKEVSKDSKLFRFKAIDKEIPYFEAGQFLTLSTEIENSYVSRPYSICSAPYQVLDNEPYIEIAVKEAKGNFFSHHLLKDTKVGDKFISEIGLGDFTYDEIRDSKNVVAIAGGSGITPFISLAKEIRHGTYDINLTILYGSRTSDNIMLKEELDNLVCDNIKVIHILSDEEKEGYEHGFINEEMIKRYSKEDSSYFICGPREMVTFLQGELKKLNIKEKRIRFDYLASPSDISKVRDYPTDKKDQTFKLTVYQGVDKCVISCNSNESILVALERAKIKQNNSCRAGYCGFCRTKLISGEVYIYKEHDYRRKADTEFNYVHACITYPLSDLEIRIPIID